jgi:Tol biopolymer transport system component
MTTAPSQLTSALADRYAIERELGAGGMATVYLAKDLKHEREVALKVLRPELGAVLGADRFLAEIKISARLDHPHILTLIDSGASDGFLWYVLPYVRGESLRHRLTREKQLGIDEALAITRQVASALDYAHRQGVIHRDIKPENILLQEGEAILADFGIALAVRQAGGNRLTETGLSLGTPQYMSPEQATGDRQLDARSDVYSLAAVLYEMLTGEPPVTGATAQAMIAKLMTERPTRVRAVRDTVPQAVDDAIARALAKIPADRYHGALEFSEALHTATEGRGGATAPPPPPHAARSRAPWYVAGAALLVALVAVVFTLGRGGAGTTAVPQYAPERQVTFSGDVGRLALAPDGRTAAYVTLDRGTIVLQDLDGGGSQPIYAAPKGSYVERAEWSADGSRILFGVVGTGLQLMSIPRLGGEPRLEMDLSHLLRLNGLALFPAGRGEWVVLSDRRFYVGSDPASLRQAGGYLAGSGVVQIPMTGGMDPFVVSSPDGSWIAVFAPDTLLGWASSILSRDGKSGSGPVPEWAELVVCGWTADGSSVYLYQLRGPDLLRAPVDRRTGKPKAPPVLVYPRLQGASEVRVSEDGRRLVFAGGPTTTRIRVFTLDRTPDYSDNPETVLSQGTAEWRGPSFLPDGRIVVAGVAQDGYDVIALSGPNDPPKLLTQRRGGTRLPVQRLHPSPDGQSFAMVDAVRRKGQPAVVTLLDVQTGRTRDISLPEYPSDMAWSADGRHLGGMTTLSPNRVMTVDIATGTARSVELQCGDRCEFAYESIAIGPEWPLAAVSSQNDIWIANLETGAVRLLVADGWSAVAWLGDWVYFTRRAGQSAMRQEALFRVRASGGKEERLIDLPPDCEILTATISPDGRSVACGEVTVRQDIHVIDDFDPAVAKP